MHAFKTPILLCGLLFSLISCQKSHDNPPPKGADSTVTTAKDSAFTVRYGLGQHSDEIQFDSLVNYEAIFSEPGGKVLLDTLLPYNVYPTRTFTTKYRVLDYTVVYYLSQYKYTYVYTYKNISPSTPLTTDTLPYPPYHPQEMEILYTNTPSNSKYLFNFDSPNGSFTESNGVTFTETTSDINRLFLSVGNDVVISYPTLGIYNVHQMQSSKDTVDLSHMDTATPMTYTKPSGMVLQLAELSGYPDTTIDGFVGLMGLASFTQPKAEFYYPGNKYFQAFNLFYIASGVTLDEAAGYTCLRCATIPSNPSIPDASYITITGNQKDNIGVIWPKQKPSFYEADLSADSISYTIYNYQSDSAAMHPITILNTVNARKLSPGLINSLALNKIGMTYGTLNNGTYFNQQYAVSPTRQAPGLKYGKAPAVRLK